MAARKAAEKSPAKKNAAGAESTTTPARAAGEHNEAEDHHCPVVGFGASAGGLEAFSDVLQQLPANTGMAVVFIQHLDPTHSSVLTELLARATRMPVHQATDGMKAEPNRLYVIPPNSNLSIDQGALRLHPRQPGAPHMPIDHFFRSLAQDQGGRAIGVVLSGTASDGTLGLKAIKAEGGIAIAQSPESAKYDGMPRSAIAAGCVDFVLPPDAIAGELVRLCRHPYLNRPRPTERQIESERAFNEIFAMLRADTGVDFNCYKPGTIRRRTLRRMALHRLERLDQYVSYLREHQDEMKQLFQDILINVTGFFREAETFSLMRAQVLPALFQNRRAADPVRVWVPGCATGEEAYSIGICLLEHMREVQIEFPIQIFGTDISDSALEKARGGVYPASIAADVSPEQLRRFFVRVNGTYQISRFVRDMCIFARQNVTKDPPFSKLDLITCRNVLIYLGPPLQRKVLRLFHYALKPRGYLVLGASESVSTAGELFVPVDKQHKIYSRSSAPAVIATDLGSYEGVEAHQPVRTAPDAGHVSDSLRRVDQMILSRYSPPAVVVDKDLRVLQFRGHTEPYVGHAPGEASLSLTKMARGGLGADIHKLVQKADLKAATVESDPIALTVDGKVRSVRIWVTPVHGLSKPQFLVAFEEVSSPPSQHKPATSSRRVLDLERELVSARQHLQSVIEEQEAATEELKSAHEEVQSSNEELQSTNEELLTAKEELQSTNEELTTVNEEMQSRNMELQQINNDLLNLLSSVNIPIIMLGNDLRIRRFTPQAEKILNLLPADVGRPVSDFRLKINVAELVALCQEVIDTLMAREREVQDTEGRIYSMWVRPYRTADNRIDGVVLALLEITERKQAAEARYRRLFEAAKDGIVIADAASGEILDSNPFVTRLFGIPRSRLIGVKYWECELLAGTEIDASVSAHLQEHEFVQKTLALPAEAGERVEVEVVAFLYAEGDRKVIQFNIRDLSARRRIEEKVRRTEEQLRLSEKIEAVGRLAGGVAHDFNNLLTAVLGYAELLAQDLGDKQPQRDMLDQIHTAAERAVALTKQLLTFGRKQILRPVVLDTNEIVTEMQQLVSVMLKENIELTINLAPETGRVRADRTQLEQVILNLVLNARDAMPGGGALTIETANVDVDEAFSGRHPVVPVGHYVAFTVKDTGTGMDEETKSHLFEPFFTTKPKGSGVGLGLSSTYSIVRQSGGYIWAYSELGVGSTFTVYLPRVEAEVTAEAAPATPEQARGTETVLLVEDEPAVRALARRFLEASGYRVLDAPNGPEALRISRSFEGTIHAMVTDVVMPRMSGRELAFQLAPERPAMKVLYMSGHTEDAILHHGIREQGFAFLQKPFTQTALAAKVRQLLDGTEPGKAEEPQPEKSES